MSRLKMDKRTTEFARRNGFSRIGARTPMTGSQTKETVELVLSGKAKISHSKVMTNVARGLNEYNRKDPLHQIERQMRDRV